MPLRWVAGELRLVCANAYPPNPQAEGVFLVQGPPDDPIFPPLSPAQDHPMVLIGGYALFRMVHPPNAQGQVQPLGLGDVPVRLYACTTCGYVETYLARVVAADEWPDV